MLPLITLLSARDGVDCASLGAADETLRTSLLALVVAADAPPTVSMRAASCLLTVYPTDPVVVAEASMWMRNPTQLGLALLVASRLPELPVVQARTLAAAVEGNPDAAVRTQIRSRLADDARLTVK